uniref:Uncharacterized protein n=1 Tax=Cannabis sativa TaxID=3483 RepID=A0A803P4A0_CANSA
MDLSSKSAAKSIVFTIISSQPIALTANMDELEDQENCHPNKSFKRQFDNLSLRKMLKRCRASSSHSPSLSLVEVITNQQVSDFNEDSADLEDVSAVIAQQYRFSS